MKQTPLTTRRVHLVNLVPGHYERLFRLVTSSKNNSLWEPSSFGQSYESWVQRLWDGVYSQFAIQSTTGEWSVDGLVRCHHLNFRHQTAQLSVVVDADRQGWGFGLEAAGLLIDELFSRLPLRKIYAECLAPNLKQFAHGEGKFFEIEGHLRNHEIHGGELVDSYILGITLELWLEHGRPLLLRLQES